MPWLLILDYLSEQYQSFGNLMVCIYLNITLSLILMFNHWLVKEPMIQYPFKLVYNVVMSLLLVLTLVIVNMEDHLQQTNAGGRCQNSSTIYYHHDCRINSIYCNIWIHSASTEGVRDADWCQLYKE